MYALWHWQPMADVFFGFFCKQKTAYEMRISDWSSDVCSSDLLTLIGVLIFVDHDGVELTCPCPGHLRITLERQKWLQNEVVEVHAIVFAHARFIFLEHFKVRLLQRLVFEAAARTDRKSTRLNSSH